MKNPFGISIAHLTPGPARRIVQQNKNMRVDDTYPLFFKQIFSPM